MQHGAKNTKTFYHPKLCKEQPKPVDSAETMSSVLANLNNIEYNTFSGKIDASYKDNKGKDYNFDVKLNMQQNQLIWMSVTGPLSIEVARVLITKRFGKNFK